MTSHFVDTFVKQGYYRNPIEENKMSDFFKSKGFADSYQSYHPFGIEELVMVYDTSFSGTVQPPNSWQDILKPEYRGMLSQMGKEQQDHFGFIMMLYLHDKLNSEGIKRFAENVKIKQHFTHTIKNIGKQNERSSPVNIMHQFASKFIRSEARETVKIIDAVDGNPSVCHFFLLKKSASENAVEMTNHLYSGQIKSIIEKTGTTHITSSMPLSGNKKIQWIGWDTLRELPLPYLKEKLSEIAYNHFKQ
jgi:ABC-type Fe3+ transport system substrate-binding protein